MSEVNAIEVTTPASVDINRVDGVSTPVAKEESMVEYGARREAELRGETPVKPAAVIEVEKPAAATEESAAATEDAIVTDQTTSESANEEDPEKQIEETHPAKKGIQKRFGELTAEREKARAEAEEAKANETQARKEADEFKAELEKLRTEALEKIAPVVPKAEEDPVPTRDQFDDPDEFAVALSGHAVREEMRKANALAEAAQTALKEAEQQRIQEENQARVQVQITELHKTFNDRVEKAQSDYPDYAEKVMNNESLTLRNDVFFSIEQAEMAPHILYHLATNPGEAEKLNALSPTGVLMRLGELQAELRIARKPKVSKAAEPVTPIGSRASPERKTPQEETMDEYAARREQEENEARSKKRRVR